MAGLSRRGFLKLAAGGGAAAAVVYSGKTIEKLIPYVTPPAPTVPGTWAYYSTVCRECPAGCGMVLWHRDGRVTKAEGNPDHPINSGALCPRGQSSVQGLYDPDRIRGPMVRAAEGRAPKTVTWDEAIAGVSDRIASGGGRVVVLSDLQTSALAEVMAAFTQTLGNGAQLLLYEPLHAESIRRAHEMLFGKAVVPDHRLDECDFVVSFAADFLETWVSPVQFARQFAQAHSYRFANTDSYGDGSVARFVYAGPRMSMTAANADRFIPVAPGAEAEIAVAMAAAVAKRVQGERGQQAQDALRQLGMDKPALPEAIDQKAIDELAKQFVSAGASVALAGPAGAAGPLSLRGALAAALMNHAAGRYGQTVDISRAHALSDCTPIAQVGKALESLTSKDVLIVLNANPAYTFSDGADLVRKAGAVAYLGTQPCETEKLANWVLPTDYPLETWGDYDAFTDVHGLMQPTMQRLYDTRNAGDVFLAVARAMGKPLTRPGAAAPAETFEQWLRQRWQTLAVSEPMGEFWQDSQRRGGGWEKDQKVRPAPVKLELQLPADASRIAAAPKTATGAIPLFAWPSIMLYDGRTANRGWLQENPEPVSYIAWSSWLDIHPETAKKLGLLHNDLVRIHSPHGTVENVPIRVTETQAPGCAAISLGQGHTGMGYNADGVGASAWKLLAPSGAHDMLADVRIEKTGSSDGPVYCSATQEQHEREILQWTEVEKLHGMNWGDGEDLILPLPEGYKPDKDIYKPQQYAKYRWAMAIDLQRCIGCGACAVACYAENNLQVVGPHNTRRFLSMPWLKVVPYRNEEDRSQLGFLPMLCQHCDTGPCEPVCPVYASVHSEEGLNAQVYNRCVGTRYCSNNCPYKVRRFNWFNAPLRDKPEKRPEWVKPLDLQLNPEVTVRCRGVMEKCTFCIQRIRQAQHRARLENRPVRDGEIAPACVQTCPAGVFTFGNLLDPNAKITQITRNDPRRYHVLEEQNTKPAVTYLRRIVLNGK